LLIFGLFSVGPPGKFSADALDYSHHSSMLILTLVLWDWLLTAV